MTLTTDIRRAPVVRGGRDGHQPVTIGDGFATTFPPDDFDVPDVHTAAERGPLWASP
ncbi:hypothetical protein [Streptomyces sp. NPDC001980]|uniref:hypothetical protein n=1 Tax=Streptomyces sp. NPDC001980 TaxID=3157126 RepID=UPI003323FD4C